MPDNFLVIIRREERSLSSAAVLALFIYLYQGGVGNQYRYCSEERY